MKEERIDMNQNETDNAAQSNLSAAPAVGSMNQMALQENVMQSAASGESFADVMIINLDSPRPDSEPNDLEARDSEARDPETRDPEIRDPENGYGGTPALSEDADSGMMNDAEQTR